MRDSKRTGLDRGSRFVISLSSTSNKNIGPTGATTPFFQFEADNTNTTNGCPFWSLFTMSTSNNNSSNNDATLLGTAKAWALGSGAVVAVVSQLVLSQLLWTNDILSTEKSILDVLQFSLVWSFWTSVMIFASMLVVMRILQLRYAAVFADNDWNVFCVEVHHVLGALAAVSWTWLLKDFSTTIHQEEGWERRPWMGAAMCLAVYGLFLVGMWCVSSNEEKTQEATKSLPHADTYNSNNDGFFAHQLVASILGLLVGACSQFILANLLWNAVEQIPVLSNIVQFSLLWSVCTVTLTSAVCGALQCLISGSKRLHLRMEAAYVSSTLIGICSAWIAMDVMWDMQEQIVPSVGLLVLSLVLFRVILYCFPEECCLEDDDDQTLPLREDEPEETV